MSLFKKLIPSARQISRLTALNQTTVSRCFASEASGSDLNLTFTSPYEVLYDKRGVKQVDVPSYSGNFGILANHVPCLAVLKPGVVTVYEEDGSAKKYFVSSGTITVNDDSSVQVLAEEAVPVEWIDLQASQDILAKAQAELSSASTDEAKAEAQIGIEVGEALLKVNE